MLINYSAAIGNNATIKVKQTISEQVKLFDNIDFGPYETKIARAIVIDALNHLSVAYNGNYASEREQMSQSLGEAAGGQMAAKLQAAFIQPVSGLVASSGIDFVHGAMKEHNAKIRQKQLEGGGRRLQLVDGRISLGQRTPYSGPYSGVAAGSDAIEGELAVSRNAKPSQNKGKAANNNTNNSNKTVASKRAANNNNNTNINNEIDQLAPKFSLAPKTLSPFDPNSEPSHELKDVTFNHPSNLSDKALKAQFNQDILKPEFLLDQGQKEIRWEYEKRFAGTIKSNQKAAVGEYLDLVRGGDGIRFMIEKTTGEKVGSYSGEPQAMASRLQAQGKFGKIEKLGEKEKETSASTKETWQLPSGESYKKGDVNWDQIRTNGPKEYVGKTNIQARRAGHLPQLPSGEFVVDKASSAKIEQTKTRVRSLSNPSKAQIQEFAISDRPISSNYYSNIFQAKLKHNEHLPGYSDKLHFQESNKQLYNQLAANSDFATLMENLYPGITKAVSPNKNGNFPSKPPAELGLTWHHNSYEAGVMELIPREHHRASGAVQKNLHPNNKGGMQIWGGGRKYDQ